jgi:thioredoxin reductase/pSer/pThr/pTyr-binding forkhead associated (FHA) protein/NAD-dependent dihydropyrimidine dehydrogenase PreA subunit
VFLLRFEAGPNVGRELEVRGSSIKLGSGPLCDVCIADPGVAYEHCMLTSTKRGLILQDLGSDTGTRIRSADSAPIHRPVTIAIGERLFLGSTAVAVIRVAEDLPDAGPTKPDLPVADTRPVPTKRVLDDSPTLMVKSPLSALQKPPAHASRAEARPSRPAVEPKRDPVTTFPSATPAIVLDPIPGDDPADRAAEYGLVGRLVFLSGPHHRRHVLFLDEAVTIGRAEDNDVVIVDPQVGLHSFRISKSVDGYFIDAIDDTPSLNGAPIPKSGSPIGHGQLLSIGASEMEFLAPGIDMDAEDAMQTVVVRQPVFAYQGRVEKIDVIEIGRDPLGFIFLDDTSVERNHARVTFEFPVFYLEAVGSAAIYLDDARLVKHRLKNGDVVRIGGFDVSFEIQGYRCGVEVDAVEAPAEIPKFAADNDVASPFQTIFRLPGDFEAAKKEDKKDVDRRELIWTPPDDVRQTWRIPLMVVSGVVLSLAVAGALAFEGGGSFLRRPISTRHRSVTFSTQVTEKLGNRDGCLACHETFTGPVVSRCEVCHEGHAKDVRPAHAKVEGLPGTCTKCHAEHPRGAPSPGLVDGDCSGCHADRHEKLKALVPVMAKQEPPAGIGLHAANILADLAFEEQKSLALHRRHGTLSRGCAACHADGADERDAPWGACFSCHSPVAALDSTRCGNCHREHGKEWATAAVGTLLDPSPSGTALATVLLLFLPMVLLFFGHVVFERKAEWQARKPPPPQEPPEPPLCEGAVAGKAKKLPRLLVNKCTSSGECVEACPYQVLEMLDKRPVVKAPELCHECATCVAVCGPGALLMWEPDKPLPMEKRPSIDPNYLTGVKGDEHKVYVIGEAAGKPLVKNGINVGYWTIQHMKFEQITPGDGAKEGLDYDVVIAGSGPSGLSAAMTAKKEGYRYLLLERRDVFATTVQDYPRKKKLMESPPAPTPDFPGGVRLVGPLWIADTTREEVLERWRPEVEGLAIRYGEHVVDVDPKGKGFVVKTASGSVYSALRVVLAPGTRGDPRKLGKDVTGRDLPKVRYRLVDAAEHRGHRIVVVGGGDSALEAAIQMAEVHEKSNEVSIVYRGDSFNRAKLGNRRKIEELLAEGRLRVHFKANPKAVTDTSVVLDTGDEIPNDVVYCMLGANPPTEWMESLGIKMVQKPIDWEPPPSDQPAFLQFETLR